MKEKYRFAKRALAIGIIVYFLSLTLAGCGRETQVAELTEDSETYSVNDNEDQPELCERWIIDSTTFELAPDLVVHPEFDELVTLQARTSGSRLTIEFTNTLDYEIIYEDTWRGFRDLIQYFDGENWRIVPQAYELDEHIEDPMVTISPGDTSRFRFDLLTGFIVPENGLFRVRLRTFINDYRHDLVAEFTLNIE